MYKLYENFNNIHTGSHTVLPLHLSLWDWMCSRVPFAEQPVWADPGGEIRVWGSRLVTYLRWRQRLDLPAVGARCHAEAKCGSGLTTPVGSGGKAASPLFPFYFYDNTPLYWSHGEIREIFSYHVIHVLKPLAFFFTECSWKRSSNATCLTKVFNFSVLISQKCAICNEQFGKSHMYCENLSGSRYVPEYNLSVLFCPYSVWICL